MRKRWFIIITIICLSGILTACQTNGETTAEQIEQDAASLCSDECNGRLPGSTENKSEHIQEGELIQPEAEEQTGPVEEGQLPFDQPMEMMFASGAGAWRTDLLLHPDGSFEGGYSNADMTIESVCSFHGRFRDITQVTDASWSLTLDELVLDTKYPLGQEWDDGMIHYISSDPYGFSKQDSEGDWVPLEPGAQFMFYTPDASGYHPTDELYGFSSDNTDDDSVMYQFWTWMPFSSKIVTWDWDTRLGCYALCNMETGSGFFDLKAWNLA